MKLHNNRRNVAWVTVGTVVALIGSVLAVIPIMLVGFVIMGIGLW